METVLAVILCIVAFGICVAIVYRTYTGKVEEKKSVIVSDLQVPTPKKPVLKPKKKAKKGRRR